MTTSFTGFGGGHGLYVTLRALNLLKSQHRRDIHICGVVGVSDDGGSSGRLREQFPIVPPGDLRMALAALCPLDRQENSNENIEEFIQYRFATVPDTDLAGHVLGNVMLTALWSQGHSTVQGLDILGRFIGAQGRVFPSTDLPTVMKAQVAGLDPVNPEKTRELVGQVGVATTTGQVVSTSLQPPQPAACPEAVEAVIQSDYLLFGPGSWFTSVTPHLLIPELREAIRVSDAKKILVVNLHEQRGETSGFSSVDYLKSWVKMADEIPLDYIIADPQFVHNEADFNDAARSIGAQVSWASVARNSETHDPLLLASAFDNVVTKERGNIWL
jgi:uncharacterized cofD-like protein